MRRRGPRLTSHSAVSSSVCTSSACAWIRQRHCDRWLPVRPRYRNDARACQRRPGPHRGVAGYRPPCGEPW
jgi:hypothetical protein